MYEYILKHKSKNHYVGSDDGITFHSKHGWEDYMLNEKLIFSFRDTVYSPEHRLDDKLHVHDYFEFILYLEGDVEFIIGDRRTVPQPVSLMWFRPGVMHTVRLLRDSRYKRYIFYLKPELFNYPDDHPEMLGFIGKCGTSSCLPIKIEYQPELFGMLEKMKMVATNEDMLTAFALMVLIFRFFNEHCDIPAIESSPLPESVSKIKKYIDENYATIDSVESVAKHFFYSREYVSRLFRKYYNTSISSYITRYRIFESQKLLNSGVPVTDACYGSGFNNMTTYISAFKRIVGILPSHYIKNRKNEK